MHAGGNRFIRQSGAAMRNQFIHAVVGWGQLRKGKAVIS
jgi:hypothetical protein